MDDDEANETVVLSRYMDVSQKAFDCFNHNETILKKNNLAYKQYSKIRSVYAKKRQKCQARYTYALKKIRNDCFRYGFMYGAEKILNFASFERAGDFKYVERMAVYTWLLSICEAKNLFNIILNDVNPWIAFDSYNFNEEEELQKNTTGEIIKTYKMVKKRREIKTEDPEMVDEGVKFAFSMNIDMIQKCIDVICQFAKNLWQAHKTKKKTWIDLEQLIYREKSKFKKDTLKSRNLYDVDRAVDWNFCLENSSSVHYWSFRRMQLAVDKMYKNEMPPETVFYIDKALDNFVREDAEINNYYQTRLHLLVNEFPRLLFIVTLEQITHRAISKSWEEKRIPFGFVQQCFIYKIATIENVNNRIGTHMLFDFEQRDIYGNLLKTSEMVEFCKEHYESGEFLFEQLQQSEDIKNIWQSLLGKIEPNLISCVAVLSILNEKCNEAIESGHGSQMVQNLVDYYAHILVNELPPRGNYYVMGPTQADLICQEISWLLDEELSDK